MIGYKNSYCPRCSILAYLKCEPEFKTNLTFLWFLIDSICPNLFNAQKVISVHNASILTKHEENYVEETQVRSLQLENQDENLC